MGWVKILSGNAGTSSLGVAGDIFTGFGILVLSVHPICRRIKVTVRPVRS